MADYVEKWGDDIDSAVELALKDLKLTRDQVDVKVLEQPSKGFLGLFKNKLAKVRVEKKSEKTEKTEVKEVVKPVKTEFKAEKTETVKPVDEVKSEEKVSEAFAETTETAPAEVITEKREKSYSNNYRDDRKNSPRGNRDRDRDSRGGKKYTRAPQMQTKFTITAEDTDAVAAQDEPSVKFIEEIARDMGLTIDVIGTIKEETIYINLEGKDVGSMIGKRGQTLDAIQYLSSIVQNKNAERHIRVIINAEKYREKREKTLQQLARRLADKCIRSGKNVRLEPMNPYERKVIHSALQTHPKVTTRSEGVEPNRRVIIELKR